MKTYTVVCGWDEGLSFIRTGLCLPPRFPGNSAAAADIRRWLASLANHSGRWVVGTPGPAADNPWQLPGPRGLDTIIGRRPSLAAPELPLRHLWSSRKNLSKSINNPKSDGDFVTPSRFRCLEVLSRCCWDERSLGTPGREVYWSVIERWEMERRGRSCVKKCAGLLPGMRSAASGEQRQWSVKLMGLSGFQLSSPASVNLG